MRAAVLRQAAGPGADADFSRLSVEQVDLAPPRHGEVLVRIGYASLCHSDLSVLTGDRPRPLPMVLGHEASGEVVDLGPGVSGVRPGDHVVFTYVAACGRCAFCAEGRPALCSRAGASNAAGTLVGGESRLADSNGAAVNHHLGISAFAEYAVVNENSLLPLPKDIPMRDGTLFGCAVTTGVGAVINAADLRMGQSAAVVGCGGVGLAAILGLRAVGAAPIIAVDRQPGQLQMARALGADVTVVSDDDVAERVREASGGGVNVVIEASGSPHALDPAYRLLRRGGTLVLVGLPNPAHRWPVDPSHLVANDITVRGSYMGSSVPARDIPRFFSLYKNGRLPVGDLIGATLPLQDVARGMAMLHAGTAGRLVLDLLDGDRSAKSS